MNLSHSTPTHTQKGSRCTGTAGEEKSTQSVHTQKSYETQRDSRKENK